MREKKKYYILCPPRNIRFLVRPSLRLSHLFIFKNKILKYWVVYHFKCPCCSASCVGQTVRHYEIWEDLLVQSIQMCILSYISMSTEFLKNYLEDLKINRITWSHLRSWCDHRNHSVLLLSGSEILKDIDQCGFAVVIGEEGVEIGNLMMQDDNTTTTASNTMKLKLLKKDVTN